MADFFRHARGAFAALALASLAAGAWPQAPAPASAPAAVPTADDPAIEARMNAIASELRCLVCQNQTIADSHADLAADLRREVRELLKQGKSDDEIRAYMTARYGDFVLYRPPLKATTAALWLGPAALLAVAIGALALTLARRRRLADDRFEPDPALDDDDADARDGVPAARTGTAA